MEVRRAIGAACVVLGGLWLGFSADPVRSHPHDPGDLLAFAPSDTIVAGDRTLRPMRVGAERWRLWERRAGRDSAVGWLEQRVDRRDTPAGRQWIVAITRTDETGDIEGRDSVWFARDGDHPVLHVSSRDQRLVELTLSGPRVSGQVRQASDSQAVEARLRLPTFPDAVRGLLLARLPLDEHYATEIATFDPWVLVLGGDNGYSDAVMRAERRVAVRVVGETRLEVAGRERRCWMLLALDRDPSGVSHTVWVDRSTRRVLRAERRAAKGDLLGWIEAATVRS